VRGKGVTVDLGLRGERVIVTGASGAIGLTCVEAFLEEDATVAGAARNLGPLDGARLVVEEAVEAFCGADIAVDGGSLKAIY
jgi:NAD(P)-dependent dehydrogenase (short-subunit alcohol dehydrogenase family)